MLMLMMLLILLLQLLLLLHLILLFLLLLLLLLLILLLVLLILLLLLLLSLFLHLILLLLLLMVIMMFGVIFIELDFAWGFQKYIILRVFSGKWLSGTSTYLEDVLHYPEVPNNDLDGWGHLHWTWSWCWCWCWCCCWVEGVLSEKWLSGTSPYLEDILQPPEVPDADHYGWGHLLN